MRYEPLARVTSNRGVMTVLNIYGRTAAQVTEELADEKAIWAQYKAERVRKNAAVKRKARAKVKSTW
jgi:hypothetical protein